jgi:hypothetical protein
LPLPYLILHREGPEALPARARAPDGRSVRLSREGEGRFVGTLDGSPVREEPFPLSDDITAIEPAGEPAYLLLDPDVEHDEVGVPLGPDRGGGIFDRTGSEGTLDREGTATAGAIPRPEFLRMAVLARIASWTPPPAPEARIDGAALRQLQRALKEEQLDAVPLPSPALPAERRRAQRSLPSPDGAPAPAQDREERTLTQLRVPLPPSLEDTPAVSAGRTSKTTSRRSPWSGEKTGWSLLLLAGGALLWRACMP